MDTPNTLGSIRILACNL